jgi:hypothetical protein
MLLIRSLRMQEWVGAVRAPWGHVQQVRVWELVLAGMGRRGVRLVVGGQELQKVGVGHGEVEEMAAVMVMVAMAAMGEAVVVVVADSGCCVL